MRSACRQAPNAGSSRDLELKAGDAELSIDSKGSVSSVKVCGRDILYKRDCPLAAALSGGSVLFPVKMQGRILSLTMEDGGRIVLQVKESDVCITLELKDVSKKYEAVMLVPVQVSVNAIVGDVIGVVQGNGVAFGMQALNIKTCAGIPQEYAGAVNAKLGYKERMHRSLHPNCRLGSLPPYGLRRTAGRIGGARRSSSTVAAATAKRCAR